MFVYFVRHGEAGKEEEDPNRGLTEGGIRAVEKIATHAVQLGLHVDEIYHSPKPRARQTARIFAEHLKPEKGINQADNLLPMDDPELWALRLSGMQDNVMLVGHLPYLERLAGLLLCGDKEKTCVNFKMGGMVCLERFEDGHWAVERVLMPEIRRHKQGT